MTAPYAITEINQGRGENDPAGVRRYWREFRVAYDADGPGPGQALQDQLVKRFDRYEEAGGFIDERALATSAETNREDIDSFNWVVTIHYSTRWWDEIERALLAGGVGHTTKPPGGGGQKPEDTSPANPLARPHQYSWGYQTQKEIFEYAYATSVNADGKPDILVKNSAGKPYDPPLETEQKLVTLTVRRNTLTYDPLFARTYFNTVNAADITIAGKTFSAESLKCDYWIADTQVENNIVFYAETLFLIHKLGRTIPNFDTGDTRQKWKRVILDAGYEELVSGSLKDITYRGTKVQTPHPLDGFGRKLADDATQDKFQYRVYVEFPPNDFSFLGLE